MTHQRNRTSTDLERLTDLLERLGHASHLAIVQSQMEAGILPYDQRDNLIRQLVDWANPNGNRRGRYAKAATLGEIGRCFNLTASAVTNMLIRSCAKESNPASEQTTPAQRVLPVIQGLPMTDAQRTKIVLVLATAAREKSSWPNGQPNKGDFLRAMGFTFSDATETEAIWRALRAGGYILEETYLGILLRYGLNTDPMDYYWKIRKERSTLEAMIGAINQALFNANLLTINSYDCVTFLEAKLLEALAQIGT